MARNPYLPSEEALRIFKLLLDKAESLGLPPAAIKDVTFSSAKETIYLPIPLKETELIAALKAVEASLAAAIADLRYGQANRKIEIDLERVTCFAFQSYLVTLGGLGKLDKGIRAKLKKDTDLLQAQSNPYRRMSANLYRTSDADKYYHIHGSLEASRTLQMIGLEPFRPDLTDYREIIETIEAKVEQFSVAELEEMNCVNRQAGVPVLKHSEFIKTPHGQVNTTIPPWSTTPLETSSPAIPFPKNDDKTRRPLAGIKVLELCRIIAGPTITRILAEYGADVLKITGPNLSDVPFFQVDVNMGKHTAELDLKSEDGRRQFEALLADVDVFVDGYRPGAIEKLGYGPRELAKLAEKRGKGIVYVNENCFGYDGEWANRPGWQQIADCVTGVAWAQGEFMGLDEPVVPPFPISDYGTGCMGAVAALTGLHRRATQGGSWHGKVSLVQYDLLLVSLGQYSKAEQEQLRARQPPAFFKLRHHDSVDVVSETTLAGMRAQFPWLFANDHNEHNEHEDDNDEHATQYCERWYAAAYEAELNIVKPVAQIEGVTVGFQRASRPNGWDAATWDFGRDEDHRI